MPGSPSPMACRVRQDFRIAAAARTPGAIRLRSDVERKRLAGLGALADSRAEGLNLYDAAATARTYEHLLATAATALRAGYPVILDAAFLRRDERARAQALATRLGVPFAIVDCRAPLAVLRERLQARRGNASEADTGVLERLRSVAEPLAGDELVSVDSTACDPAVQGRAGADVAMPLQQAGRIANESESADASEMQHRAWRRDPSRQAEGDRG